VVFDLKEQGPYRVVASDTPKTILVEFPEMQHLSTQTAWVAPDPLVQTVRIIAEPAGVRAEIHLRQPGQVYRHFRMEAPARVVVDISPERAPTSANREQQATPVNEEPHRDQPIAKASEVPPPAQPTPQAVPPARTEANASPPPRPEPTTPRAAPLQEIPLTLSAEQLLRQAEDEWASQQYKAAQLSYQTFLVRFPQHAQNHLIATRLADILRAEVHYREALEAYAKVIETYPHSEGALISMIRLAELHITAPDLIPAADVKPRHQPYASPIPVLQQLIADYPLHSLAQMARYTIGLLLLARHDTNGALEIFHQLLSSSLTATLREEVEAKLSEALQRLLTERIQQGEYLTALRTFFAHKGRLAPQQVMQPAVIHLVAQSYAGLGLLEEAAHLLQLLLEKASLTPEQRAEIALERTMVLLQNGKANEAKAQVAGLEELPNDALERQRRRVLGEIALHEQQPAEAARHLQPLTELFGTVGEQAHMQARLAQAYAAQGEPEQAMQAWQQCTTLLNQDTAGLASLAEDCLFQTGRLHFAQQHYKEALTVFEALLQRFPESSRWDLIHFYMAESFRQLEDEPHMLEHIRTLRDKAHAPFWQKIAEEYEQNAAWRERFHERLAAFHNTLTH
jgi:tetratricopeptide (TPR) repeat protein